MPATRTNRRNNPLRKLRLILGDEEQPMHQQEFADRIGVSVATVRSVEAGRRKMTQDNCLNQILVTLKATWNEEDQTWHVLGSKWRYEKRHADALSQEMDPEDPYCNDLALHRLIERVFDVFAAATREQRQALLIYLSKHLAEICAGSGIEPGLSKTEPHWYSTAGPFVWGKALPKGIVFLPRYLEAPGRERPDPGPHADAGGIFDFRSRRTFNPQDYPAHTIAEAEAIFASRNSATTAENGNFNRSYSVAKPAKPKKAPKKKKEYRLEIES
jgi:transcriptional regulator with XRE-family HTH domain